ncbi:hypothetical protein EB796_001521 [Bugula neritina]|uniref:Uncharacterized protein n=1 Tax=Bugula neritina TaxID=10212 RepID=A0A7J7KPR1_BUGNE|nr:hypothetical protein EB796_001521 [Bugula neritina]
MLIAQNNYFEEERQGMRCFHPSYSTSSLVCSASLLIRGRYSSDFFFGEFFIMFDYSSLINVQLNESKLTKDPHFCNSPFIGIVVSRSTPAPDSCFKATLL